MKLNVEETHHSKYLIERDIEDGVAKYTGNINFILVLKSDLGSMIIALLNVSFHLTLVFSGRCILDSDKNRDVTIYTFLKIAVLRHVTNMNCGHSLKHDQIDFHG